MEKSCHFSTSEGTSFWLCCLRQGPRETMEWRVVLRLEGPDACQVWQLVGLGNQAAYGGIITSCLPIVNSNSKRLATTLWCCPISLSAAFSYEYLCLSNVSPYSDDVKEKHFFSDRGIRVSFLCLGSVIQSQKRIWSLHLLDPLSMLASNVEVSGNSLKWYPNY